MSIAVVKTGGKQYKVKEGDILNVELLQFNKKENDEKTAAIKTEKKSGIQKRKVEFEDILDGKRIGAEIVELKTKGPKISILKFKNKVRYIKRKGHRQKYTKIKITSIK